MDIATVDAHGMYLLSLPAFSYCTLSIYGSAGAECGGELYKHIGVGFALLVQLYRAMRRPQEAERVTSTDLHAFFVYKGDTFIGCKKFS